MTEQSNRRRPSGQLEADVLAALWQASEPLRPAQVLDALGGDLAYTTVMTTLTRLHEKGLVDRERCGRAYVYQPRLGPAQLAASRMRAVLDSEPDREAVLARFVGSLSGAEERALARHLRRRAGRRRS